MYFYFQPRWYITWSSLPYWNNFNKPHRIYRTIVFETTGHQIMMDNDPRVWKQMRWVRDCPSLLPLEKVQATAQLKWRNKAELQKLPELRKEPSFQDQGNWSLNGRKESYIERTEICSESPIHPKDSMHESITTL